MIIFLYGPDTYRSLQKLNEIIERYKKIHKSGLNLKYFDAKDLNFQDFKGEFRTSSMFAEKKLFIVRNIFLNSEFKEKFLENLNFFKESNNMILIYEKEISQAQIGILKQNSQSQEFSLIEGYKLKNWIKKEFEKYNMKVSTPVLEKLINFVGNNLWQLSQEIKKLVNYIGPGTKTVGEEEIELLVKPKIDTNIFKTIDAIATKNKKTALKLVHQHLEKGDSPFYLFSMLNFQFRNLLLIKTQHQYTYSAPVTRVKDLSRELGMHHYVVKKAIWQSEKFSLDDLKKIYQKIFQVDLDIKTGKLDPQTALDLLIAEI